MTRDEAIEIARRCAKAKPQSYWYEANERGLPFQPHEWVIDAILAAATNAESMRPVYDAALALRVITKKAEGMATPLEAKAQIVDNANAFRVLFDAVDAVTKEPS